jgi:6-phosphogluconate dehydrogenase
MPIVPGSVSREVCAFGAGKTQQENFVMQIAMIGLGRMGGNMVERLLRGGHQVVGCDIPKQQKVLDQYVAKGAIGVTSWSDAVAKLQKPRVVWLMLPSTEITELAVTGFGDLLEAGDILIDGGNSFFKDDLRRAKALSSRGIHYVDVGTSGGVWGLERGYALMIGGPTPVVQHLDPIFKTLAPGPSGIAPSKWQGKEQSGTCVNGYLHCGPVGAGHFVKMVHNGIEYGIMQAYAEGFDIFKKAKTPEYEYNFDLPAIAELWRRGSVIVSWLLDLTAMALLDNPTLSNYTGYVQDSGEGRWTVLAAVEQAVPADVLTASLYTRFRSRQEHTFAEKMLSAMRFMFGNHVEQPPIKE